eukprot:2083472-Karenia_brevis.AAC.1
MQAMKSEQASGFNDIKSILGDMQLRGAGTSSDGPAALGKGPGLGSTPPPSEHASTFGDDITMTMDMHNIFCETMSLRSGAS